MSREVEIKNPCMAWWAGDPRVEPYMPKVKAAIERHVEPRSQASTDIYNRCYEAIYQAIKDHADSKAGV
jgi:hypothetical protein